jgi:sterol 3beta-glucosyltransferase
MKIGMQTWGSHGDIRPMLALAEGLQAAGHDVTLVITCVDSAAYAGITSAAGVDIRVVASPVIAPEAAEKVGEAAVRMRNPMAQMAHLLEHCFAPAEEAMFTAARQLSTACDVLIGHYFMHPLQVAAEFACKPYVSVLLSHAVIPSAYSHPIRHPFGQVGNRFLWWLTRAALHRTIGPYPNRLRSNMGMAPTHDVVSDIWLSRHLTLVGISPQICARQPDWPSSVQVTGFLDMPNMQLEGQIGAELDAFLAAGEAPVYMTMGSWMPRDIALQTTALQSLTEAARLAGCRAIIQSADARACGFTSDERILYTGAAPHHLVFPRCRTVVHHGGAGTTQSVTLAGKPSVVLAHISEQEHWGQELQRLGIAGKALHVRSATPRQLAARIGEVLRTPSMTERAGQIARAMAMENGVAAAVRLIEEKFERVGIAA